MEGFSREDIVNDPAVKEFLESKRMAESTIKNYLIRFRHYSNYTGRSPTVLIEEAEQEEDSGLRSNRRKIKKYLNGFARFLDTTEFAPGQRYSETTINRSIVDIKTFYHYFDIETPKVDRLTENAPRRDDLPSMDEIKKALRNVGTRDKALILLHLSSGMGRAEVIELITTDFLKGLGLPENTPLEDLRSKTPDNPICTFWVIRVKENIEYVTFCSPECVYAIIDYLEEKGSYSEYLFPGRNGKMAKASHIGIFNRINDKLGFGRTANGKQRRFMSHKLRAVFATNMYSAGVDWSKIDQMLGHSTQTITRAYRRPSDEVYKKAYIEGLDAITTNKVNVLNFLSPEFKQNLDRINDLEKENDNLKTQIGTLIKRLESVEEQQFTLGNMKKMMDEAQQLYEERGLNTGNDENTFIKMVDELSEKYREK